MIDKIALQIPLNESIVFTVADGEEAILDYKRLAMLGLKIKSDDVEFALDGTSNPQELGHPYESLPSSFSSMACKVFKASHLKPWPYLEIKASPAKLLQGHNVFGSTDFRLCSFELLLTLSNSLPEFYKHLDIHLTEITVIDNTFSSRYEGSSEEGKQFIAHLKNVSNRYLKSGSKKEDYETTCYFDEESREMRAKVYLKEYEFENSRKKLRMRKGDFMNEFHKELMGILNDVRLEAFAKNLIRFEATIFKRKMKRIGVPTSLSRFLKYFDEFELKNGEGSLSRYFWELEFLDLIKALEGKNMKILTDGEVHNKLKLRFQKITPKGNVSYAKADRVFGFYQRLVSNGYKNVYRTMARNTFKRHKDNLLIIGFSIAQLQNLHGDTSNVVPLVKYIEIDFSSQRPDWYTEPVSQALRHFNNVSLLKRIA